VAPPYRALFRLDDIAANISAIRSLLDARTFDDVRDDIPTRAAFERFLEIICEAARHLPEEWRNEHPEIPWRRLVDLGNQLRHAYHHTNPAILWSIYVNDLGQLETSVREMIAAHGPIPERPEDVKKD
jgi:uncharacterized protein with HEPN domain